MTLFFLATGLWLFCNIIPEHIDGFVPYFFRSFVALEVEGQCCVELGRKTPVQRISLELRLISFQNPVSSLRCFRFCPQCTGSTGAIIIAMFLELPASFSEIPYSHYVITAHLHQMDGYFDRRICFFCV